MTKNLLISDILPGMSFLVINMCEYLI